MKEDSLYFGVFLKVVYNCIWKMTHLCIKLRKLKLTSPLDKGFASLSIGASHKITIQATIIIATHKLVSY